MPNTEPSADLPEQWNEKLAATVGNELRRIRNDQGLSAVALSELTKQLGHPITRGTIAKIEGNHRSGKLDVTELLVLAAALKVPPLLLLFPPYPDGHVQPLPDVTTTAHDAAEWVSGRAHMTGHPNVKYRPTPHQLVALTDERDGLNDVFAQLLERRNDPKWMDRVFEEIDRVDERRDKINIKLAELGGVVAAQDINDGEG